MRLISFGILILYSITSSAFIDSTDHREKIERVKKQFCKARIIGMSPNKVISIGYDLGGPQTLSSSEIGKYSKDEKVGFIGYGDYSMVSGMRFMAKVPIINKDKLIWQIGINYLRTNYQKKNINNILANRFYLSEMKKLTSLGLNTSIYKPFNKKEFIIALVSADLNGDYTFSKMHPLKFLKYSIVGMYGLKVSKRKQWALGVARSYGAGISTVLPVFMFNYTSKNEKWGAEILLPARAWYRYTFNKSSILRIGFELEGASYRLLNAGNSLKNMELRRGELRNKLEYQCKIYKSFWLAIQTGYCHILNYNLDYLGDKKDFSRQFNPNKPYAMINKMSNFMFLNLSINFVSL